MYIVKNFDLWIIENFKLEILFFSLSLSPFLAFPFLFLAFIQSYSCLFEKAKRQRAFAQISVF